MQFSYVDKNKRILYNFTGTLEQAELNCPHGAEIIKCSDLTNEYSYTTVKKSTTPTPGELVRRHRNILLNEVDLIYCNAERWSLMPPEKQQEWSAYKQALRDFPDYCTDLENPVWPAPPQ